MSNISQKIIDRFTKTHKTIAKALHSAVDRDINEADTVVLVNDIFEEVLGYDKYTEITREFAIRGTYCDLAIKIDNDILFLIEVKAIGVHLNEKHVKQAVDYAANQGIDWVILTNGIHWQVYKLRFEKPINTTLIFSFNFLELSLKKKEDQEKLFTLSREGIKKNAILELSEYNQFVNKFYITAIIQEEGFIDNIRKTIKKALPKAKIESEKILNILNSEIIKRDIIESEELPMAKKEYNKFLKKGKKQKK